MKPALDQSELTAAIEQLESERATLETRLRTLGRVVPAMGAHDEQDILERYEALEDHVAGLRVQTSVATPRTPAKGPAPAAAKPLRDPAGLTARALAARGLNPQEKVNLLP